MAPVESGAGMQQVAHPRKEIVTERAEPLSLPGKDEGMMRAPVPNSRRGEQAAAGIANADKGVRDPAFPRPSDMVRLSFAASRTKTEISESATYSSALPLYALLEAYSTAATSDGWDERVRNESGDLPENRYISLQYFKGLSEAEIRIYPGPDNTSTSNVSVRTTLETPPRSKETP